MLNSSINFPVSQTIITYFTETALAVKKYFFPETKIPCAEIKYGYGNALDVTHIYKVHELRKLQRKLRHIFKTL